MGLLDEDAVERLYSGTADRLHRYLARRVGAEIADDLVAEAFLVLWRDRAGHPHEPDATVAWLYGVATNLVRRHVRAEERRLRAWTREHARTVPDEDPLGRVDDVTDAEALTGPLRRMLADLPREQRDVLTLVAWGELTPAQVSAALGIGESTVRTRLHRARAKLRTRIAAHLEQERTGDV